MARCANTWCRYICALLRSLDRSDVTLSLSQLQLTRCVALRHALTEGHDLRQPIQSLSYAMLTTYEPNVERDSSLCPLMRFIVFWHLREDGTFHPPSSISPNLASMTFCFRTIAVLDLHTRILADPTLTCLRFVAYLGPIPAHQQAHSYYRNTLLPLLKEGYPTPFNNLRQLTHLVSAHAYDAVKFPDMHWNAKRDTLSVKGYPLEIDLIPQMAQALRAKAQALLDQLLLGADTGEFDRIIEASLQPHDPISWPIDPLRNTQQGFSFVHSPDNAFHPHLDMLLKHIHSTPSLFDTYHAMDIHGRVVPKPS